MITTLKRDITIHGNDHCKEQLKGQRQEKDLLKAFVKSSPAAIAMLDTQFRYLAVSDEWCKLYNLNSNVLLEAPFFASFPHAERDWQQLFIKCLEGKTTKAEEERIVQADGSECWIKWEARTWENECNQVGGLVVFTDDITVSKRQKEELKEARDLAQQASKAKATFLSVISHEIRTPLNALVGLSHILLDSHPRQGQVENLNLMRFSAENLLSLVNDILDMGKIESSQIQLQEVDFSLKDLLKNIHRAQQYQVVEKGLELTLNYDNNLPDRFHGDPTRLSQIINNLIGNAVKFTEKGCVQVLVEVKEIVDRSCTFHVAISDTGIGIPKPQQSKIFDIFTQGNQEVSKKYGGTGIGLSIVRKLLRIMGSDIHLTSEMGLGSTFYFDLKLPLARESRKKNQRSLVSAEDLKHLNLSLLVAEDNVANQMIIHQLLKSWRVSYDIVENGQEALEKIKENSYDLVLMDLRMPVMDGYEATKKIREMKDSRLVKLPIVALTASSISEIDGDLYEMGLNDYLQKPFLPKELFKKILKYSSKEKLQNLSAENERSPKKRKEGTRKRADKASLIASLSVYTEGNETFLKELVNVLVNTFAETCNDLVLYFEQKDPHGLGDLIHKLKPTLEVIRPNPLLDELSDMKVKWSNSEFEKEELHEVNGLIFDLVALLQEIRKERRSVQSQIPKPLTIEVENG